MKHFSFPLLAFLFLIPQASGWNSATHMKFVENAFYQLDFPVDVVLDLDALRNGSVAPDLVFHDTRRHHYPPSFVEAHRWLNETRIGLAQKNYTYASYAFGVTAHYITDTYAAPHHIQKEPSRMHSLYEQQGNRVYFFVNCSSLAARAISEQDFLRGVEQNRTWEPWIQTQDPLYPQRAVRAAAIIILQLAQHTFHANCTYTTTEQESFEANVPFTISWWRIFVIVLLLCWIMYLLFSLLYLIY